MSNNRASEALSIQEPLNQKEAVGQNSNFAKYFQTGAKQQNGPTRLVLTGDQTKQMIRSARSGSVKHKLNLQNTRLKINVENLSSLLTVHQNNETRYKQELDRYKQKILRYKQKIKQKDVIIARLLEKLQRKIQIDTRSLENILLKMHEEHIRGYRSKINRGQSIDINELLNKYQQLLKGYSKTTKENQYLETEKQDLQKTVQQLKQTIKHVANGKMDPSSSKFQSSRQNQLLVENQKFKIKIAELEKIVEKEKSIRNRVLEKLGHQGQIDAQVKDMIVDVERQTGSYRFGNQQEQAVTMVEQVQSLKKKLAANQLNLLSQKQSRRSTQKHCNMIQEQLQDISKKMLNSNSSLKSLEARIQKIHETYASQLKQFQEKTSALLNQSTNLDNYKSHIDELSRKFSETIKNFSQEAEKWAKLESEYQRKMDDLRNNKSYLQEKLEKQTQKRRLFEVKLMGEDQDIQKVKSVNLSDEEKLTQYLDQRVSIIRKQSLKNRKDNENLSQELSRGKRAYTILEKQLKDADQKIYNLQQLLKSHRIPISSDPSMPASSPPIESTSAKMSGESKKQPTTSQEYISAYNENKKHTQFLESQMKQLRTKYIDLQMDFEESKKNVENLQIENARILANLRKKEEDGKSGRHDGKVLAQGESYLEKSTIQGGYKVNIINVNDIPVQIQKMQFQQLAIKYLQSRDQLLYLKQKMQQSIRQQQSPTSGRPPSRPTSNQPLDMILSQPEYEPEDGASQSVDDDTYKNINEEMDRLVGKNKQLERELIQQKIQKESQVQGLNLLCLELKDKLKSAEEINNNLSNIVVHLETELAKHQMGGMDSSVVEQRGSEQMEASSKSKLEHREPRGGKEEEEDAKYGDNKYEEKYEDTKYGDNRDLLQKKIDQKRKQFDDMLKSNISQNHKQAVQYQNKLRALQLQIRSLQQKQKPGSKAEMPALASQQCPNCQNLTKLSSELVQKLQKLQQQKQQKLNSFKTQVQQYQPESITMGSPTSSNAQQLQKQNNHLRQLIAEIKTQLSYDNKQRQQYENQIKNLREINEELVASIHEKQKVMLKLRTDLYRQNFEKLGIDDTSAKKIEDIFQTYQAKIQELENVIKGLEKSQVNISDLYDTINYLNSQCQNLRKALSQQISQSQASTQPMPPRIPHQNSPEELPSTFQQLKEKYQILSSEYNGVWQKAKQNNFNSIAEMVNSAQQQKQKNIQLMKENNKLQNKIINMNVKYEEYFKKINQGKTYEIIQDKDKEIDGVRQENAGFKDQLHLLQNERREMFEENQKITQDLRSIEENILKLTGGKSMLQSTLPDRSFSKTIIQKPPKQKKISGQQAIYALQTMAPKLELLKSQLTNSSHKSRPNLQIPSIHEISSLEDILIVLLDRLHFAWNLVQERTTQYNQLRDQMNIISMQCMKNGGWEDVEKSRQSSNKNKNTEILEQRYQQVLAELIQYETQNKRLEKEVNRLKQQLGVYKREVQEVHSKYAIDLKSESSQDLPYNKNTLNKFLESSSVMAGGAAQKEIPEIIKLFLGRIKELESNLEAIQLSFDEKNRKLQSLIQKQKSFISQKSRVRKEESVQSQNSESRNKEALQESQKYDIVSPLIRNPSVPVSNGDEKSYYSMNSVKLFKQIEQLTKTNEELRDKNQKYKILLQNVSKVMEIAVSGKSKNALEDRLRNQMEKILTNVNLSLQEEGRKDNSDFDLENDQILGSSFSKGGQGSQHIDKEKGLQQIQDSLQGPKSMTSLSKSRKREQQASKQIQSNARFLEQNKFLFQQLFNKLEKLQKSSENIETVKTILAQKLSDKQLQEMLYLLEPEQAIAKILQIIAESGDPHKKVEEKKVEKGQKKEENVGIKEKQIEKQGDISVEEGQWVETAQLQAIINQIYPTKTQLCLLVANSINMLMMAQTKQGILKAVQFLFSNLKCKETQFKQQMRRRDESVTEYGRKLQKILASKYSQDQSQQKSDMMNQNSFRRASEFKSENQIMEQAGYARSRNNLSSSEESQSYSRITYDK